MRATNKTTTTEKIASVSMLCVCVVGSPDMGPVRPKMEVARVRHGLPPLGCAGPHRAVVGGVDRRGLVRSGCRPRQGARRGRTRRSFAAIDEGQKH
eukprot:9176101-Pyramimonas_sp.AAC.1